MEYKVCPVCGKKLKQLECTTGKIYVCADSTCRKVIKDNCIGEVELEKYCEMQQRFTDDDSNEDLENTAYMLLKQNLNGPMLIKNTNSVLENRRNTYCIVKALSKDDAIKQFNDKFEYTNVKDEMVVKILIQEVI